MPDPQNWVLKLKQYRHLPVDWTISVWLRSNFGT